MLIGVGGLAGCGKAVQGPTGGMAALGGGNGEQAKLNAYTTADNTLLGGYGLTEEYRQYAKEDIPNKKPDDIYVPISDGWMDQARGELKSARGLPAGSLPDVDTAADKLLTALNAVLARQDGLKVYYESKAYKDDGLARGRREDPLLIADYKTAMAAMTGFETVLQQHRSARTDRELAILKSRGDMLAYDTKLSIKQARAVIDTFKKPEDLHNPALIARADGEVAQLEHTLVDQRAEIAKAKQRETGTQQFSYSQYGSANDSLNQMLGYYRDFKHSGQPTDYSNAIGAFNSAVGDVNSVVSVRGG